jgi:YfiR/HmsC-like
MTVLRPSGERRGVPRWALPPLWVLPVRALTLALLVSALGFSSPSAADEADVRRETQLKSAYLLNFVKFVEWPMAATPDEPLTVCFLGASGMRETLEAGIESKHVGTRPLAVRQIEKSDKTDRCNVLYVEEKWALTLQSASHEPRLPILTVSDAREFAQHGGIIELFTDENHLRFIINVDNAHRAGLRISSELLQLAAVVEQGKPP